MSGNTDICIIYFVGFLWTGFRETIEKVCKDSGNMLTGTVMDIFTFLYLQVEDNISRAFAVFFKLKRGVLNTT